MDSGSGWRFFPKGEKKGSRNLLLTFTCVDVLSWDVLSMAIIFLIRVFMFTEYR